jgi:hypothetical protein
VHRATRLAALHVAIAVVAALALLTAPATVLGELGKRAASAARDPQVAQWDCAAAAPLCIANGDTQPALARHEQRPRDPTSGTPSLTRAVAPVASHHDREPRPRIRARTSHASAVRTHARLMVYRN